MTIDDEYGHPVETGGEFARPEKLSGHLLIIYPIGYVQHIQTRFSQPGKRSDAICCDIVDLDENDEFTNRPGKIYRSSNLMQSQLIVGLRPFIGKKVLGLITRGVARNGMNPPWIVTDMSSDPKCVEIARSWAAGNPDFYPSTFSPTPPPVAAEPPPSPVPSNQYQQPAPTYQPPAPAYHAPAPAAPAVRPTLQSMHRALAAEPPPSPVPSNKYQHPAPTYQPPAPAYHAPAPAAPAVSPTLQSMSSAAVEGAGRWLPDQPPAPAPQSAPAQPQQYTTEELEMLQALRLERERRERAAQAQQGDNPPF